MNVPTNRPQPQDRGEQAVAFGLLGVLIVAPLAWVIGYSFLYSVGGIGLLSDRWTLEHWRSALLVGGLRESLFYSAAISVIVTVIAMILSLGCTMLAPHLRDDSRFLAMLCIPLATPGIVMALICTNWLSPGGFFARLAFAAGWIDSPSQFPILVNDRWSIGLAMTQICGATPLLTLYFLKTWSAVRADRHCRLAESLGATSFQARWRVARPMLIRRGRLMILLVFLLNFGSFEVPTMLGRQFPQMISVLSQRRFGQFNLDERPEAFVLATAYLLFVSAGVMTMLKWRDSRD